MAAAASARSIYQRIFSGIQPTGIPHLGNYLGAIRNWVDLQSKSDQILYCVVDLHSLTVYRRAETVKQNVRDMVISLMACGVDPDKSILFQQSKVSQHAELAWILGCKTPVGILNRMTQWKAKKTEIGGGMEHLGLLSYPILMAADILLYRASHVPVGDDQLQHLELARHIARTFNGMYNTNIFPEPEPILGDVTRVMSFRDPIRKMSKSDQSANSRINLTDTDDLISKKIRLAVTDTISSVTFDLDKRPGVSNLVLMYAALTHQTPNDVIQQMMGKDTSQLKAELIECTVSTLRPIRKKITELQREEAFIVQKINEGCRKATDLASQHFCDIKSLIGI